MLMAGVAALIILAISLYTLIVALTLRNTVNCALRDALALAKMHSVQENAAFTERQLIELSRGFDTIPILRNPWRKFRATLSISDGADRLVQRTTSLHEFIALPAIGARQRHYPHLVKFPGFVTSIGLMLTFTFITHGLSQLDAGSQKALTESIPRLVNSLGAKFVFSIAGMFIALIYSPLWAELTRSLEANIAKVSEVIDDMIPPLDVAGRTAEGLGVQRAILGVINHVAADVAPMASGALALLRDIATNTEEAQLQLRNFSSDLASRLDQAVQRAVEQSQATVNAQISTQLETMVKDFGAMLSSHTTEYFTALAGLFRETSASIGGAFEASQGFSAELREHLRMTGELASLQQKACERLSEAVAQVDQCIAAVSSSLPVVERTSQAAKAVIEVAKEAAVVNDRVAGQIGSVMDNATRSHSDMLARSAEGVDRVIARVEELIGSQRKATGELLSIAAESLPRMSAVSAHANQLLDAAPPVIATMVDGLRALQTNVTAELDKRLSEFASTTAHQLADLNRQIQGEFSELVDHFAEARNTHEQMQVPEAKAAA